MGEWWKHGQLSVDHLADDNFREFIHLMIVDMDTRLVANLRDRVRPFQGCDPFYLMARSAELGRLSPWLSFTQC